MPGISRHFCTPDRRNRGKGFSDHVLRPFSLNWNALGHFDDCDKGANRRDPVQIGVENSLLFGSIPDFYCSRMLFSCIFLFFLQISSCSVKMPTTDPRIKPLFRKVATTIGKCSVA